MKKTKMLLAVFSAVSMLSISGVASAHCWSCRNGGEANSPIVRSNNEVGFALEVPFINYKEIVGDGDKGYGFGAQAKVSFMNNFFTKNLYAKMKASYSYTSMHYYDFYHNREINFDEPGSMTDLDVELGKGFMFGKKNFMVTPYLLAGYHKWTRGEDATVDGVLNYKEKYTNFVGGIGAMLQYNPINALVLTLDTNIDAVLDGKVEAIIPEYNYDGTADFGTSAREYIGLKADYALPIDNHHIHIYGGISYSHFNYTGGPASDLTVGHTTYRMTEPPSWTNLVNYKVGVAYSF